MSARIDITGNRFGRLTVIAFSHTGKWGKAVWACTCDCGNQTLISGEDLRSGNSISCGCFRRENIGNLTRTHALTKTSIYNRWKEMMGRCYNPQHPRYADYGGRGIKVCFPWWNFQTFYAAVGDPPPRRVMDRTDNDGDYTPENFRWSTYRESNLNTRRQKKAK